MLSARTRARALAMCAVLAVLCLQACGGSKESAADPAKSAPKSALKVTLVKAQAKQLQRQINATGSITARDEVLLGVELSGQRVEKVWVEVGQVVKAGQVLLTLDARTMAAELAEAKAQLRKAEAALVVAESDARRGAELRKRGLVSERDTDQTTANLINAQAGLSVAKASVQTAELRHSFATLKASSAGVISARNVQAGQVVMAGADLFRMIKDSALEWRAELNEQQFLQVAVGAPVEVRTDEVVVQGKVRAMDAGLRTESRTAVIYVDLPLDSKLRAGLFAQGSINLGEKAAMVVPSSALVRRDGFSYVFVVKDGVATQTRIEIGQIADEYVEILSGLPEGAGIVEQGAGFLTDGDRVEVVIPAASGAAP